MERASNVKVLIYFIENHLAFLTIKDIMKLLRISRIIRIFQRTFPFLIQIGRICVNPDQPYNRDLRSYFKKLLLRYKTEGPGISETQAKTLAELETKYVFSRNAILNSDGKYGLEGWANQDDGWTVQAKGGHPLKHKCFMTHREEHCMHYTVPVKKFLTPEPTIEDLTERAIFKGGCYMHIIPGRCAFGIVALIAYDMKNKEVFKQEVHLADDTPNKKVEIRFKLTDAASKSVKLIRLAVSGKDRNGGHGVRFYGAYMRCYYNGIEGVSSDLDISCKVEKKLTLEEESKTIKLNNMVPKYDPMYWPDPYPQPVLESSNSGYWS